jgi:hypothetical protein
MKRLEVKAMSVPPANPQDTQAVIAVLLIIAVVVSAIYWRLAFKILLIAVIVLIVYGAIAGFHDVRSLLTAHHQR